MKERNCPYCGNDVVEKVYPSRHVARCCSCGLVFTVTEYSDEELQNHYSSTYLRVSKKGNYTNVSAPQDEISKLLSTHDSSWFEAQAADLMGWLPKVFGRDSGESCNFLEIGTGWGRVCLAAKMIGWKPIGYELAEPNCEIGGLLGLDIRNEDFCQTDAPTDFFDCIFLSHSFEHVHSPKKTMDKLYSSCAKGGVIFLAVPNFSSFWHECRGEKWEWLCPKEHLTHFTCETLEMIVQNAGFSVLENTTYMSTDPQSMNYKLLASKLETQDSNLIQEKLKAMELERKGESIWITAKKYN